MGLLDEVAKEAQTPAAGTFSAQELSEPQTPASSQPAAGSFTAQELSGSLLDQVAAEDAAGKQQTNNPRQTGEITNDVGQKVIVPKGGESFSDTMKRAIQYHKSLTPAQQQAALDAETKTMPKKTAQTLGAAATIGAVGPALLAVPGEIAEAVPSVLTHTVEGVKAIGSWAAKNPVQAYLLFQVMKELVPGAKKAMGVIKGVPEAE